jgi:hypothetical protein
LYAEGRQRFRVFVAVHADEDAAKDVVSTLRRHGAFSKIKKAPFGAFRSRLSETIGGASHETSWVFARHGAQIWGLGDDPMAEPVPPPETERDPARWYSLESSDKLDRLVQAIRRAARPVR